MNERMNECTAWFSVGKLLSSVEMSSSALTGRTFGVSARQRPQAELLKGRVRSEEGAVRFFQAANGPQTHEFGGWWAFSRMEHAATNPGLIPAGAESPLLSTTQPREISF